MILFLMMKRRIQKTSIFICCEGKTELAFLKYIKSLYLAGDKKRIHIRSEDGGSLSSMQKTIEKQKNHLPIDKAYILLDGDQINSENIQSENILISEPCIEGFFLKILTGSKPQTSQECKRKFEKEYLNRKDKLDHRAYKNIFRKDDLEKKRYDIPLLHAILEIFEEEK